MEELLKVKKLDSELRVLLKDIISGMEFPIKGKSLSGSVLDELRSRLGPNANMSLGEEEKHFGNMLRELDTLLLETEAVYLLIKRIRESLDPAIREKFKDRRVRRRKPIENFMRTF